MRFLQSKSRTPKTHSLHRHTEDYKLCVLCNGAFTRDRFTKYHFKPVCEECRQYLTSFHKGLTLEELNTMIRDKQLQRVAHKARELKIATMQTV